MTGIQELFQNIENDGIDGIPKFELDGIVSRLRDQAPPATNVDQEECYWIGYCWYAIPGLWRESIPWFEQALFLDPGYLVARLYLGHALFDNLDYNGALEAFTDVASVLGGPSWRVLKNQELILCCQLELLPTTARSIPKELIKDSSRILNKYRCEPEDRVATPTELIRCLSRVCDDHGNCDAILRKSLLDYLECSGVRELFTGELLQVLNTE